MKEPQVPTNLHGATKAWAQTLILSGMLAYVWSRRRELGISATELPRYLRDLLVLAAGPTDLKYVAHNGKIFLDGWTPPAPTEGFFRAMASVPSFVNADDPVQAGPCVYAVVSITNRCIYRCEHCYAMHTLGQQDRVPREVLLRTVDRMLDHGIGILSLEGGEPMKRYDDLLAVLDLAKGRTNPYVATTGWSIDGTRARELADAGLVAAQVSLDHFEPEAHNAMRRSPKAFDVAVRALGHLRDAGVFPIISMVATPELLSSGGLFRFLDFAKDIGVGLVQVIDPLPSSANAADQETSRVLTAAQRQEVLDFHVEANTSPRWADHPAVSARLYVESESSLGCGWGGLGIYYLDSFGNVTPCPYANISVGNVLEEDFDDIYRRMRQTFPRPIGGLCPAYTLTKEEARARLKGLPLPLPPERTAEVAAQFSARPLPRLLQRIDHRR